MLVAGPGSFASIRSKPAGPPTGLEAPGTENQDVPGFSKKKNRGDKKDPDDCQNQSQLRIKRTVDIRV